MPKLLGLCLLLAAVGAGIFVGMKVEQRKVANVPSKKLCDLRMALRKLWEDHMIYTHDFIVSAIADLEDVDAVTKRLLQNQVDLGNAVKPFYGNEAGDKLAALLKDHILIAADVVKAAKANSPTLTEATKRWYANADDIAAFLSGANPNWSRATLQDMLHKHLDYVTGQAVSRLHKEWQKDIDYYDTNHNHMLHLADALAEGIVQQFA